MAAMRVVDVPENAVGGRQGTGPPSTTAGPPDPFYVLEKKALALEAEFEVLTKRLGSDRTQRVEDAFMDLTAGLAELSQDLLLGSIKCG